MSLEFNATGDYAELFNNTTALGSSVNSTLLVWYRKQDSTNERHIALIKFGSVHATWWVSPNAGNVRIVVGGGVLATDYALATNTYAALAIVRSGRYISAYAWTEAGVRTDVALNYDTYNYASQTASMSFGNGSTGYGDTASGQYRYGRFWSRALSAAELDAEIAMTPSSGTPAASTTNLRGSWGLPDGTTGTDWSGNSNTLTINSGSTGADEPSIPSGGASAAVLAGAYYAMLRN